jgi:hypothetical protein
MMLPEDSAPWELTWYWRTPRRDCQGPGYMPNQGVRIRQTGLTVRKGLMRITLGSSSF